MLRYSFRRIQMSVEASQVRLLRVFVADRVNHFRRKQLVLNDIVSVAFWSELLDGIQNSVRVPDEPCGICWFVVRPNPDDRTRASVNPFELCYMSSKASTKTSIYLQEAGG